MYRLNQQMMTVDEYIAAVKEAAKQAGEARHKKAGELPLRDMAAWSVLRAAQAWIANREPPRRAWQGERVRRAALQIGYRRPVMEGRHVGLIRPQMSFDLLTHDVAVFPEGIRTRRIPPIASSLLHEATHLVHREIFCERHEMTSDEAFILCDLNDAESRRTIFTAEALAFWNEACWLLAHSPQDIGEGGYDQMTVHATHAVNRPHEAMGSYAGALLCYTRACGWGSHSGFHLPLWKMSGSQAGMPIKVGDLAPAILEPLLDVVGL